VGAMVSASEPLQRFIHRRKPLKRLWDSSAYHTPLKRGVNESHAAVYR
jgi:hypothetical protein